MYLSVNILYSNSIFTQNGFRKLLRFKPSSLRLFIYASNELIISIYAILLINLCYNDGINMLRFCIFFKIKKKINNNNNNKYNNNNKNMSIECITCAITISITVLNVNVFVGR